jgi:hypothetical protein
VGTTGISAFGSEWIMLPDQSVVARVDPATSSVSASVTLDSTPRGIASDSQSVWVLTSDHVSRIDPSSNTVTLQLSVPTSTQAIAANGGRLFVADSAGQVLSFDSGTGNQVAVTEAVAEPMSIAASNDAVAVADSSTSTVYILSPGDLSTTATVPSKGQAGLAFGGGYFWMTSSSFGTLSKVDSTGNVIDTIQVAEGGPSPRVFYPIATNNAVWVLLGDSAMYRVDPTTDRVTARIPVPGIIGAVVDTQLGTVWTMNGSNTIQPLGPTPTPSVA